VSVVYQALDTVRGRRAAIKMLDPTLAGDTHAQERIRREAMITDRVRHPGVPRVFDFGDAPLADGTVVPYVVMELIAGTQLTGHLATGPLPWPDAVRTAATIADVLTAVHKRGVVHRDLTAANIMLTADGAKLVDFGVAVTVQAPDPGKGPYVIAPPARPTNDFAGPGEPADDVYALGVLLYQMVTGHSPYPADRNTLTDTGTMRWVAPTPVFTVPGLPRAVAEICRRCMGKRPADRPDAASVALDLWATLMATPDALYQRKPAAPTATQVAVVTEQPTRAARPGQSGSNRRTVDLGRRRRRPAWSGPTTGQNAVVRSR
jgi:serine/threonine-protein kinase